MLKRNFQCSCTVCFLIEFSHTKIVFLFSHTNATGMKKTTYIKILSWDIPWDNPYNPGCRLRKKPGWHDVWGSRTKLLIRLSPFPQEIRPIFWKVSFKDSWSFWEKNSCYAFNPSRQRSQALVEELEAIEFEQLKDQSLEMPGIPAVDGEEERNTAIQVVRVLSTLITYSTMEWMIFAGAPLARKWWHIWHQKKCICFRF